MNKPSPIAGRGHPGVGSVEALRRHHRYDRTRHAFAAFLTARAVDVMGDGCGYGQNSSRYSARPDADLRDARSQLDPERLYDLQNGAQRGIATR